VHCDAARGRGDDHGDQANPVAASKRVTAARHQQNTWRRYPRRVIRPSPSPTGTL
jgi:hypothetical protein